MIRSLRRDEVEDDAEEEKEEKWDVESSFLLAVNDTS